MKIKSNGIDINYEIEGDGPWLTLSHSLCCDLHMWDEQMPALTKQFKVLRFDTRGHGASSAPAGAYTLEQMADDVRGLFDALGIKQTHWCGLSMGGMIGQTFALRHPGYFKTMILADTTSYYPPETQGPWADRIKLAQEKGMAPFGEMMVSRWFTEGYVKSGAPALTRIAASVRATKADGFIGCCHAIPKINLTAKLKDIKCPTLVIVGEQDPGTPVAMARDIHAAMPGSELVILPDAAHLSNIEQTAAFNDALTDFIARHA